MNTFLPYESFAHSVACLDRARLGKQRLECAQILAALLPHAGMPSGWRSHPATLMWAGYESALSLYQTMCCREWAARGYQQTTVPPYGDAWQLLAWAEGRGLAADARDAPTPPWLGDERLHLSHQRALMAKDPEHYRAFGWRVVPGIDYWWPTKETETA